MAPGAVKLLGGMSRNQLANLAVDVGVDAVFLGKDLAALYLFYDYITSDDEEEKAELEEEFKDLQIKGTQKDSGSSAITDVSANQAE
jgi:hypothetical protein